MFRVLIEVVLQVSLDIFNRTVEISMIFFF